MRINADEIASVIQMEIEKYESQLDVREVGTVLEVGDGIARVYGLSGVMNGEMVEFEGGVSGYAFNLEENSVSVVVRGDYLQIEEGAEVRALGKLLSVPVGDAVRRGHRGRGQFSRFAPSYCGYGGDFDGGVLHVQGRACPDCVRRLVEASIGLSPIVAARPPAAGTRSVSR